MASKENTATDTKTSRRRKDVTIEREILFSSKNYTIIGAGLGLVALGFLLMMGGGMENPDQWDADVIYSARRITLAPFIVLLGFCVIVFSIFKSSK